MRFDLKTRVFTFLCCMCYLLFLSTIDSDAKAPNLLRIPGANLLLGYGVIEVLTVTTSSETIKVLPAPDQPKMGTYPNYPTPIFSNISLNGRTVACIRLKSGNPKRVAVATYSITEKKWTEYAQGEY